MAKAFLKSQQTSFQDLLSIKYALDQSAMVVITNEKGIITYANDKFCQRSQYSRQELMGKTHRIVNSGFHSQAFFADLWSTITKGDIWRGEIKNKARDGTCYWTSCTIIPFLDEQNIPWQYLAIGYDITEVKEKREQLAFQAKLLDKVEQAVIVTDLEGKIIYWNHYAEVFYGWSISEVIGRSIMDVTISNITKDKSIEIMTFLAQGNSWSGEFEVKRKNGETFPAWVIDSPIHDEQGKFIGIIGISINIAQKKQLNQALKASEQNFRQLAENIPEVFFIQNHDHSKIIYISSAYEKIWGRSCQSLYEEPDSWIDSVHPDDLPWLLDNFKNQLTTQIPFCGEYRIFRPNGEIRWIFVRSFFIRNKNGNIERTVGIAEDITKRKLAEEEKQQLLQQIEQYNKTLETKVLVRTHQLKVINEQLEEEIEERKQTAKQLKASLKEKELLLKEVHHRVKNNLQIISSILSLQSNYIQEPQILSTLQDTQNRIASMALIHEKLYESKNLGQISFTDYLTNLAQNLFSSYNINPHLIKLKLEVEDIPLDVDTAIPCGLLINELVSNSLKHAFREKQVGQITISFSVMVKGELCIEVRDNGIGLPTDFDVEQTGSLGLRLIRALTRQMRGLLEIDNNPNLGTTFKIIFPNL